MPAGCGVALVCSVWLTREREESQAVLYDQQHKGKRRRSLKEETLEEEALAVDRLITCRPKEASTRRRSNHGRNYCGDVRSEAQRPSEHTAGGSDDTARCWRREQR